MSANRLFAVVIGALSLAYLYVAYQIPVFPIPRPVDSDAFPKLLGLLMLGLSVWLYFEKDDAAGAADADQDGDTRSAWSRWQPVVVTALAVGVYASALAWLGFVLASFVLTAGLTWFYGFRRHGINAAVSLAVPLGLYLAMTRLMNIHLPAGVLPF